MDYNINIRHHRSLQSNKILPHQKEGDNMNVNLEKISEVQTVADKLAELPKEALLYIAGYAEGVRDKPKRKKKTVKPA